MPRSTALLTDEDRALLSKVGNLLEEVIETLNILEDEDTMKSIKEAEEDIKAGRVRNYNDFTKELKQLANAKTFISPTVANRLMT